VAQIGQNLYSALATAAPQLGQAVPAGAAAAGASGASFAPHEAQNAVAASTGWWHDEHTGPGAAPGWLPLAGAYTRVAGVPAVADGEGMAMAEAERGFPQSMQ
jgi:hypothetical protein